MIKVLIADDHRVFREGITSILQEVADISIVAEANRGEEVLPQLEIHQPQVVLMDISFGDTNGIDLTQTVLAAHPQVAVLALSMHSETPYIVKMLEAGARGYVLKEAGRDELIRAIRTVAAGNTYFDNQVSAALVEHLTKPASHDKKVVPLTKREMEILHLIIAEHSNGEIAEKLFISVRTVDAHRRNLLEKTGAKNTVGLVKYALRHGLIE